MRCDNIQETRGAVMFTDEEYSKELMQRGIQPEQEKFPIATDHTKKQNGECIV